jgi:hypothetical protein
MSAGTGFVHGIAFAPDLKALAWAEELPALAKSAVAGRGSSSASSAGAGRIRLWDLERGVERRSFDERKPAYAVAFSPDGLTLASAGGEGARLYPLAARERETIAVTPVYCVAYSADGRYLAMGTYDDDESQGLGEIRLWDTGAGRELAILRGAMTRVSAVAFAPDGRTLAAASPQGVFFWKMSGDFREMAAAARSLVDDPEQSRLGGAGGLKKPYRSILQSEETLWLVLVGVTFLLVPGVTFKTLSVSLAVYDARAECGAFLRSWVEAEGLRLRECRELLIPAFYRLSVEDLCGMEYGGYALITGGFSSVTPSHLGKTSRVFVPRRVRYLLLWRVVRPAKRSELSARVALRNDLLVRKPEASSHADSRSD